MDKLMVLWDSTALAHFESGQLIMMAVGFLLQAGNETPGGMMDRKGCNIASRSA